MVISTFCKNLQLQGDKRRYDEGMRFNLPDELYNFILASMAVSALTPGHWPPKINEK